jgi:hypothetical protein
MDRRSTSKRTQRAIAARTSALSVMTRHGTEEPRTFRPILASGRAAVAYRFGHASNTCRGARGPTAPPNTNVRQQPSAPPPSDTRPRPQKSSQRQKFLVAFGRSSAPFIGMEIIPLERAPPDPSQVARRSFIPRRDDWSTTELLPETLGSGLGTTSRPDK